MSEVPIAEKKIDEEKIMSKCSQSLKIYQLLKKKCKI